jgi:hypothetical protein
VSETETYHVTWEIEVDATSYSDAARRAMLIQQDPESTAHVYVVSVVARRTRGTPVLIDLDEHS